MKYIKTFESFITEADSFEVQKLDDKSFLRFGNTNLPLPEKIQDAIVVASDDVFARIYKPDAFIKVKTDKGTEEKFTKMEDLVSWLNGGKYSYISTEGGDK
jgi:hypothetical protein